MQSFNDFIVVNMNKHLTNNQVTNELACLDAYVTYLQCHHDI